MPEDATQETSATDVEAETGSENAAAAATDAAPQDGLSESGRAALQKERRAAREAEKRAKAAEARVKEFEDSKKSEQEKLEQRAAEAEGKLTDAERKLMRFEVAAAKGLDLDLAPRLMGSTKEELEADADKLAEKLGAARPSRGGFDGGARSGSGEPQDMDALIRARARS